MANKSTKVLNVLISFGGLFLLAVFLVAFISEDLLSTNAILTASMLLQILLGLLVVTISIFMTKKAYQLFLGLLISVYGVLLYVMHFILPYNIYEIWPLFVVFAGIILLVTGKYKYKKFKYGFGVPAVVMICMGCWFILFSLRVIKVPFSTIAAVVGPLFMLLAAGALIMFFFLQQKHNELVIKDDNQGDFGDEEIDSEKSGR